MANFYLDGTDLTNSTAVYDDVALTTLAADGYYSDGIISRQQVSGALLPATVCPSCTPPILCTSIPTFPPGDGGRYSFDINVGESASDVGAMVISFFTGVAPDGIRVTYDGTVYNGLSSNTAGWRQGTTGNYTFLGSTIRYTSNPPNTEPQPCSEAMTTDAPNTVSRNNYILNQANNQWQLDGTSTNVSIESGDLQFEVNPDMSDENNETWNTMVIPKLNATPSIVAVEVASSCVFTSWTFEMDCPTNLPSFSSSANFASNVSTACAQTLEATVYRAGNRDTVSTTPMLYDLVFNNANGTQKRLAGFYRYSGGWYAVDSNGVIISIGACS